jgi:hypothetical protein
MNQMLSILQRVQLQTKLMHCARDYQWLLNNQKLGSLPEAEEAEEEAADSERQQQT